MVSKVFRIEFFTGLFLKLTHSPTDELFHHLKVNTYDTLIEVGY